MPVHFSQIAANSASVKITGGTLGDDSITVVYYPGRLTDKLLSSMQQLMLMEQISTDTASMNAGVSGLDALNDGLVQLIKSWDVLDEDGSMFPLSAKRLHELPIPFKVEVLFAIMKDMRPEAVAPHLNGHS